MELNSVDITHVYSSYEGDFRKFSSRQWLFRYRDLPFIIGYGETQLEAITSAQRLAEQWLVHIKANGTNVPEQNAHRRYSGKIKLRVPHSLVQQIATIAEKLRVSRSEVTKRLIEVGLARKVATDERSTLAITQAEEEFLSGEPMPESKTYVVKWTNRKDSDRVFKGMMMLRIDPVTHWHIDLVAKHERVTVTSLISSLLALGLGRWDAMLCNLSSQRVQNTTPRLR